MLWLISADTRMTRIGIMVIDLEDSTARSTPARLRVRAWCYQRDSSPAPTAPTPAAQANLRNLPNLPRENDLRNLRNLPNLRDRSASRPTVRKRVAEIAGIAEIGPGTVT